MDDLISRQAAIDALEETDWYHQNKNKDMVHGANSDLHQAWYKEQDVFKAIEQLPSAQSTMGQLTADVQATKRVPSAEPPEYKSRWIVYEVADTEEEQPIAWECAACGEVIMDCKTKYCPECGCRMENV